jgi:hypothetical protein
MLISGCSFIIYDTVYFFVSLRPGTFLINYFSLSALNYFSHFMTNGASSRHFLIKSSLKDSSVISGFFYFFFFKASSKMVRF